MKLHFVLARLFVAGETLDKTLPVVDRLLADGRFGAVDPRGAHVDRRQAAEA